MRFNQADLNLGKSKIDGYIVHGYLQKNAERSNILFGNLFFKRYYVVNFDMAQIIVFTKKPDNILLFDISDVQVIKFSSIKSVVPNERHKKTPNNYPFSFTLEIEDKHTEFFASVI